ncbi:MAG: potassium channel protein [Endomicrobiia bacterium]
MRNEIRRSIFLAILFLVILLIVGTFGYKLIEGWSFFDSIYMTVITLATVGYGETNPLTFRGRVFTIILIIFGITTFVYAISRLQSFFIEGELTGILRRRKRENKIKNLKDHYIVCGSGDNISKTIIEELLATKRNFVVIENDKSNYEQLLKNETILVINGNPAEDSVLLSAGIKTAQGLICSIPSDKDNLFIVISARSLNPSIRIISRALDPNSVTKLKKAGADTVVSTDVIGGLRMVSEAIRPTVVSFLDSMLRDKDACLRIEEVVIPPKSNFVGKTLAETQIYEKIGLLVIAVKKNDGTYVYNPKPSYNISADDVIIVIGNTEQVYKIKQML